MCIAVYAGTFDPVTFGHLSVINSASRAFQKLIALIAVHPTKEPLFSVAERMDFIRDAIPDLDNVVCDYTNGLVVEYAREQGAGFLVRGVRNETDIRYETEIANTNYSLAPEIKTFFIPADPNLACVSSSRLKEMASRGEDGSAYCTQDVWNWLQIRLECHLQYQYREITHEL